MTDPLLFPGTWRASVRVLLYGGTPSDDRRTTTGSPPKLDMETAREIRGRWRRGEAQNALAADYGVAESTICKVINQRSYREVVGGIH